MHIRTAVPATPLLSSSFSRRKRQRTNPSSPPNYLDPAQFSVQEEKPRKDSGSNFHNGTKRFTAMRRKANYCQQQSTIRHGLETEQYTVSNESVAQYDFCLLPPVPLMAATRVSHHFLFWNGLNLRKKDASPKW
ncbi:hypothetical protein KY285_033458 [Solanum tuberosum]|nr:hypothetical protein KY285_033458 [Solanum tuberosum]